MMLRDFLANHRDELIARCKSKVRLRPQRNATDGQLTNGVPLFLEQLTRTLAAEQADDPAESLRISGASGGDGLTLSEIGVGVAAHGKALLKLGFTVDQVVHDYGDLCQAITELAYERDAPFAVLEFHTLNRCLDNAIADAVTEFSSQRDAVLAEQLSSAANERLGFLVHELRNSLQLANLAVRALELGGLTLVGATGSVLKRSLAAMRTLVDGSLAEVRASSGMPVLRASFLLATLIEDARTSAQLEADARGCVLLVAAVDPALHLEANRDLLLGVLANVLSNAFKFTHPHTVVNLDAFALDDRILIEVRDRCGGLPSNYKDMMFVPFSQLGGNRTGLGLGMSIARQNAEAMGGSLTVQDVPEVGCVFTIGFPRPVLQR